MQLLNTCQEGKSGGMQMARIDRNVTALINHKMAQRPLFDWSRVFS